MRSPSPAEVRVLAVDYDRTLTDPDLRLVPEAVEALRAARRDGHKVVVVSGRDLDFLHERLGDVADVIVGENGCMLLEPGATPRPVYEGEHDVRPVLSCLSVPVEFGRVIASADVEHAPLLKEALERAGILADLVPNRDRVMVLPRGVDKAVGVLAALKVLGIPPERAAAAGDGENDIPMLREVGLGIAVANAVEELKREADVVTQLPGGHGVAAWVRDEWLNAPGVG